MIDCSWVLHSSDLLNEEPAFPLFFTQRSKINCPLLSLLRERCLFSSLCWDWPSSFACIGGR